MLRFRPIILLLLAFAVPAAATPKRPDLKEMLAQPQAKPDPYIPARAGWDGPEQNPETTVYFQELAAINSPQANRAALLDLLVPDWRTVVALMAAIFLLRYFRRTTPAASVASHKQPPGDVPRAA
ncbi:MAG: hypothetical protein ROO76_23320 [Terriglobia bacterium]|nr:hypothetical protein [Terriglobia bacterium]